MIPHALDFLYPLPEEATEKNTSSFLLLLYAGNSFFPIPGKNRLHNRRRDAGSETLAAGGKKNKIKIKT